RMIKTPQPVCGAGFGREFRLQPFCDALEAALAHVAKKCVLARKITEKCRLADFKNSYDVINAGLLISLFAKQSNRCFDDLLTQSRLLALTQPWDLLYL